MYIYFLFFFNYNEVLKKLYIYKFFLLKIYLTRYETQNKYLETFTITIALLLR